MVVQAITTQAAEGEPVAPSPDEVDALLLTLAHDLAAHAHQRLLDGSGVGQNIDYIVRLTEVAMRLRSVVRQ